MRLLQLALVVGAAMCLAVTAQAHAFLDHANPAVGSRVGTAPPLIRLWFTEPLEPALSSIQVLGPGGEHLEIGPQQVGADEPNRLSVAVKPLSPGRYRVVWRVVSVDTHVTNGDFTFEVAP